MTSLQRDATALEVAVARPQSGLTMNEAEFLAWCGEDTRAEWAEGEVILMSPASIVHNRLASFVRTLLQLYADEYDLGEALGIEVSVRLNSKRRRLPDILFIARDRAQQLKENHFEGAPNLIVEVVSRDSVERDWRVKYQEYEAAGVDEYWLIDPLYHRLEAYALGEDKIYHSLAPVDDKISSRVVPGFYLRSSWLWQEPLPKARHVLEELLAQSK